MNNLTLSLSQMMTCEGAVKRVPDPSGTPSLTGARAYSENLIRCTPIWPISAEDASRLVSQAPYEVQQIFCEPDTNVQQGNYWIQDGKEYPVVAVEDWRPSVNVSPFKRVVLHKVKARSAS